VGQRLIRRGGGAVDIGKPSCPAGQVQRQTVSKVVFSKALVGF
jgi:hypothetical protein